MSAKFGEPNSDVRLIGARGAASGQNRQKLREIPAPPTTSATR